MNPEVERYIAASGKWPDEMEELYPILLGCGLTDSIKWRKPCFSYEGKNIAIFQEMNDFLSLMFFKGALLDDPDGVLVEQGPNSRSAKRVEFTSVDDVTRMADTVVALVHKAVEVEEAGVAVAPPAELVLVEELQDRLDEDPVLAAAFAALTPGRQREYNMHFAGAKQAKTRVARVEKYVPRILAGQGMRDR